LKAIARVRPVK